MKPNKSKTFTILGRVLARVSLAGDRKWEVHQANKPVTFQPLASVSLVTNSDYADVGRILNVIIGPLCIDIGII